MTDGSSARSTGTWFSTKTAPWKSHRIRPTCEPASRTSPQPDRRSDPVHCWRDRLLGRRPAGHSEYSPAGARTAHPCAVWGGPSTGGRQDFFFRYWLWLARQLIPLELEGLVARAGE